MPNYMQQYTLPPSQLRQSDPEGYKYIWEIVGGIPMSGTKPTGRSYAAVAVDTAGENLYIFGGNRWRDLDLCGAWIDWDQTDLSVQCTNALADILKINLATMETTEVITLTYPRAGAAMGFWENKLYIVGGLSVASRFTQNGTSSQQYIREDTTVQNSTQGILSVDLTQDLTLEINREANVNNIVANLPVPNITNPAYIQIGSKIYMFGGALCPTWTVTYTGEYWKSPNIDRWWNSYGNTAVAAWTNLLTANNPTAYVYDMETNSVESLPDMPITGNAYNRVVQSIQDPNILYISNCNGDFCTYNIEDKTYTKLADLTPTERDAALVSVSDNGYKVVSMGGTFGELHCEAYDVASGQIDLYPVDSYNKHGDRIIYAAGGTPYQVCGSNANFTTNSIIEMESYAMPAAEDSPIVGKIPAGTKYNGLYTLSLPGTNQITAAQQTASSDIYIRLGDYQTRVPYTIYLEDASTSTSGGNQ